MISNMKKYGRVLFTFESNQILNNIENRTAPERITAIDQFVGSPLKSALEFHLFVYGPSLANV